MRMFDIIAHKRDGRALTDEEIDYFVEGYVNGDIPDYQASALCMAIYLRGMDPHEVAHLTMAMAASGDMLDLSDLPGITVDKHSTGGVGDKTTLVIAPIVASCGVTMAKMSGRGLGHTGGTLDKLESIPGLSVTLGSHRFKEVVRECGCAVVGQSGNLVPADKKLYALRDVTATIGSVPLIASSVMSKKIAAGPQCILLDVKCGSGAFMKDEQSALELAEAMVSIGERAGRKTVALISDMDRPLGMHVGNALEVMEACDVLKGNAVEDVTEVCIELAANLLHMAGKGSLPACRALAREQITNGRAFAQLERMVAAQGGDAACLSDYARFPQPEVSREVFATQSGWVGSMDTEQVGVASLMLGAGREKIEDAIDPSAGIVLACKTGDRVEPGTLLATLYSSSEDRLDQGERVLRGSYHITDEQPPAVPHFLARVSASGVEHMA